MRRSKPDRLKFYVLMLLFRDEYRVLALLSTQHLEHGTSLLIHGHRVIDVARPSQDAAFHVHEAIRVIAERAQDLDHIDAAPTGTAVNDGLAVARDTPDHGVFTAFAPRTYFVGGDQNLRFGNVIDRNQIFERGDLPFLWVAHVEDEQVFAAVN